MLIKIASRKSDLARLQAYNVASHLKKENTKLEVTHLFSASFGDLNPDISLNAMPEKGAFTEDFKEGIKNRSFDLVVHSWKDLPTDLSPDSLIYTLKRADPRDLLLVRKESIQKIKETKVINILTSSPRRVHHITDFVQDFIPINIDEVFCHEVRGNIPTRLEKLIKGDSNGDALIIAKAALDRLLTAKQDEFNDVQLSIKSMLKKCDFMLLPLTTFPTAAAQGALAIEVHKENTEVISILEKIHCKQTYRHVKKERKLLSSFGGGCHQKLGMTSISHAYGDFFSASGVSAESNATIKELDFIEANLNQDSPKIELSKSFPNKDLKQSFYRREAIEHTIPTDSDLYISKDFALPINFESYGNILWVSGLSSWKKLAKKGHWIHGSSESLGENFGINIDTLIDRETKWLKLTHNKSSITHHKNTLATYKLVENDIDQIQGQEENFYWMSASQFKAAINKYPEILEKRHACGAGTSYKVISKLVKKENLKIYLGYDQWYNSTIK
jgi:hydroxymethylbilane synthase